jgi:transcriptional antiterminator RfaH
MNWYLIHTKPKQEQCALLNLQQQDYECYLPMLPSEKIRQGKLAVIDEPLFPRYLFIRLSKDQSAKSWSPIRSTRGVSRLVSFGQEPAQVDDQLVKSLQTRNTDATVRPLFTPGEHVRLVDTPYAGLDAIYQMSDGESRVMVLIELLNKPVKLTLSPVNLRKIN